MKKNNTIIHFILESLRPFKKLIAWQIVTSLLWAISLSLRPYIFKVILDRISCLNPALAFDQLFGPIALYTGVGLFVVVLFRFYDYIWLKLNPPLKKHIGALLMQKMMTHSLSLFQNNFAGNLVNKVKDVMSGIPDLVKICINQFFSQFLAILIAIFTVCTINYYFGLLLAIWIIVFILGTLLFSKKAQQLCLSSSEIRSHVIGSMVDMLSNITSIHLLAIQKPELKQFDTHLDKWVVADQKRDWIFLKIFAFQGFSFIVYQTLCFIVLVNGFKKGTITAGDFSLIITINTAIINNLWTLSADVLSFSRFISEISQGLLIVLSPVEIQNKPNAKKLNVTEGKIVFNNVTFAYKNNNPTLKNLSITIPAGQKVGLVGYSGGGKTTFVNLILRLYDITEGSILIDGNDIRDVTQNSLHRSIGMIPQDPSLFNRSVLENIRYGSIHASDNDVVVAAKKAHADEFIQKLTGSYNFIVGERGSKLSGGQRQRIAIARAIIKNAPILILDEATSQLDTLTERKIQESLWHLMENKTSIVIAHRLSTLLHMDRILVFNQGEIIEDGTHENLLALNGLYKHLWNAQLNNFYHNK